MNKIVLAHAAAAAAALCAGTAVVATRFVIGETDPISLVFYRYLISVICFVPILPAIWPEEKLAASEVAKIALFGVLFFVLFPWAFNASLQYNPAARGAVGLATVPIQTLLVAAAFGRERLTAAKIAGVALAFSGIIVALGATAFGQRNSNALFGDGLMLMGVLCAAVYSVFSRATLMRHGPLFVTALAMAFAVVVLLPIVAFGQAGVGLPAFNLQEWLAVVFLGDNRRHRAVLAFHVGIALVASDHHGLVPDAQSDHGHDPGIALLGEKLTIELVAGMTLVLAGILVGSGLYRVQKKNGVNAPAGNAAQINPPTTVR